MLFKVSFDINEFETDLPPGLACDVNGGSHCEWVWSEPAGARLFRGLVLFLVITVQVAALHRRSTEWPFLFFSWSVKEEQG